MFQIFNVFLCVLTQKITFHNFFAARHNITAKAKRLLIVNVRKKRTVVSFKMEEI